MIKSIHTNVKESDMGIKKQSKSGKRDQERYAGQVYSRTSIYVLNWSKMVVLIAKSA
jgi:hypothetical protein